MVQECEDSLLRKFDTYQDYLWKWNPSKGQSGWILVGINIAKYDVGAFKQGEFMLQMNLWDKENKIKWNLLTVYGAAHEENKIEFLTELSRFCDANTDPIIVGGDFNIIRYAKEKNSNKGVHKHTGVFNSIIHFFELRELTMSGGLYTWSNNQDPPTLEKLDRILVSKSWEDIFPCAMVRKLPREISDHNPLIISCGPPKSISHIQFKFDLSWFNNPEFFEMVEKIWHKPCRASSVLDKFQQKIKLFKQFFKGWGFNVQGEMRKKRQELHDELVILEDLEETSRISREQIIRKHWILYENFKLLEQEEMYWIQSSHETWLLKGDNNT